MYRYNQFNAVIRSFGKFTADSQQQSNTPRKTDIQNCENLMSEPESDG
jgi:hypothetical protein